MACMLDEDEDVNMQRARDPDSLTVDDSGYIVASYQYLTASHSLPTPGYWDFVSQTQPPLAN